MTAARAGGQNSPLVVRFRSSSTPGARSDTKLRNLRTTSNSMILVPLFEPDGRDRICRKVGANFGFGVAAPGAIHAASSDTDAKHFPAYAFRACRRRRSIQFC